MKIVEVITGLDPGGAERIVLQLARGLAARGDEVHVVCLLPFPGNRSLLDELVSVASSVRSLGVRKYTPWRILRLRGILDRIEPTLVHSHLYHPNLVARLALRGRSTPLVNTVHNADTRASKQWLFMLDRLSKRRCNVFTAVSRASADYHAARIGLAPGSIRVIPNGVSPPSPLTRKEIETLRRGWGVEGCRFVFGAVGRLHSQKGFSRLLRVLPDYASSIPSGSFDAVVILGDGPEMEKLRRMAAGLPSNLRVILPGFHYDAARATGAFDALIMPSRYEGFCLAVADAMVHGIPVVVTPDKALLETASGYDRTFTADFDDARDAVRAMRAAAGHPPDRRPHPMTTTREMVDSYLELYDSCL